jgi:hypothetical protein
LRELISEDLVLLHKKGETLSLNPARSMEIIEFIASKNRQ